MEPGPTSAMGKVEKMAAGALAAAGAAGVALLYRYEPTSVRFFPDCPLYACTGLLCPGCGTLRATHRLLHGDLAGALSMNPLMVLALPFLAWALWATWAHNRHGRPLPWLLASSTGGWILFATLIGYMVLRNLPWHPFTLLAPG